MSLYFAAFASRFSETIGALRERPRSDGQSAVLVGLGFHPTRPTKKFRSRLAIGFFVMTTLSAHLRGILGVHGDNRHTRHRRLVLDQCSPLGETPTAPLRPLLLPEPGPLADPLQFLKGDSAMGVWSFPERVVC